MSIVAQEASSTTSTNFTLTVNSGSGGGVYVSGSTATIVATAPTAGNVFNGWTGDTVANPANGSTTIFMDSDHTVTATYTPSSSPTYTLTVVNGSGGGNYAAGHVQSIVAAAAPTGQVFSAWTGDTAILANPSASTTNATMGSAAASVTATYVNGPFYVLTVTSGSGSGSYLNGSIVTITANAPATGKVFDAWTGDAVADSSKPSTTITMSAAKSVTATYVDAAPSTYTLSVVNGTGDGAYVAASVNPIVADAPASGHVFSAWTGGGSAVANASASSTTVTMPANALTVTATYVAGPFYVLTVNSGSGGGSYLAGAVATIIANAPPAGKVFSAWTGGTVASASSPSTTVTMPAAAVTVTATYVNNPATYTLVVNNGSGDGNYAQGTVVTITADTAPTGQVFSAWTGGTVASSTSSTTTVTMPAAAVTVNATYTPVFAATFYVSTTGNNANPGTFASPFRTIVFGISKLTPGATLGVRGGTYNEEITSSPSGTSWANKVRIAGYPGETVWLSPSTVTNPSGNVIWFDGPYHYIEFDGINVDGTTAAATILSVSTNNGNDPHHIRFQNATAIAGAKGAGGAFNLGEHALIGATGGNEVINCIIHGGGLAGNCGFACASYGVYVKGPNNIVDGNEIYDTSGAFIQVYNASGDSPDNNIIRNNRMHDLTRAGTPDEVWGIICYGSNNWIYNNEISGIAVGTIGNSGLAAIAIAGNGTRVQDNTIYNNRNTGIVVGAGVSNTVLQNNIVYLSSGSNYLDNGTATVHNHNSDTGTNPLFVNASIRNFNLQGGSPCQAAGIGLSTIATDIAGRARPTSGACDIGANETP